MARNRPLSRNRSRVGRLRDNLQAWFAERGARGLYGKGQTVFARPTSKGDLAGNESGEAGAGARGHRAEECDACFFTEAVRAFFDVLGLHRRDAVGSLRQPRVKEPTTGAERHVWTPQRRRDVW
ncbi:hypothetical protein ERJ75_001393000 [Trypanosoma vivax]|nr:hypothetical protein ERJ75_001393000 [Trypanosoma vivax]